MLDVDLSLGTPNSTTPGGSGWEPQGAPGPYPAPAGSAIPHPAAESCLCCPKHLFPISKIRLVRKKLSGLFKLLPRFTEEGRGDEAVGFPKQDRLLQSKTLFKAKREGTEGEKHPF